MSKEEADNGPTLNSSSPDLRAQLDELLAAFDEIARLGRERRHQQERDGTNPRVTQ